jgi:hypothetical protein
VKRLAYVVGYAGGSSAGRTEDRGGFSPAAGMASTLLSGSWRACAALALASCIGYRVDRESASTPIGGACFAGARKRGCSNSSIWPQASELQQMVQRLTTPDGDIPLDGFHEFVEFVGSRNTFRSLHSDIRTDPAALRDDVL